MKRIGMIIAIAAALMTVEVTLAAETDKEWPPVDGVTLDIYRFR